VLTVDDILRIHLVDAEFASAELCSCAAHADPMAAPHVQEVVVPAFGGSVRLRSASGGLEALWISLRDEGGRAVIFDDATRAWLPASLRLTPNDARALAALLNRYADTHAETDG
jgi:hypothetical protein